MENKTSIAVSRKIRDRLAYLGTKDSTFDDILTNLLKSLEDKK